MAGTPKDVTKKVRMSRDRAERLAAAARDLGVSESEAIREGIELVVRRARRMKAAEALGAMIAPGETYVKGEIWLK